LITFWDRLLEKLQGCDETTIEADEAIIIQTPTGGGYGDPKDRDA
jgi:5-oxoprolinase (ATP-hydrolysing)